MLLRKTCFLFHCIRIKFSLPLFIKLDEKFQDEPKVDSAIKNMHLFSHSCSDLSATLFLNNPDSYQGGN